MLPKGKFQKCHQNESSSYMLILHSSFQFKINSIQIQKRFRGRDSQFLIFQLGQLAHSTQCSIGHKRQFYLHQSQREIPLLEKSQESFEIS